MAAWSSISIFITEAVFDVEKSNSSKCIDIFRRKYKTCWPMDFGFRTTSLLRKKKVYAKNGLSNEDLFDLKGGNHGRISNLD